MILVGLVLFLGFILRVVLVHRIIVGDIMAYLEWGEKIWMWGARTYYFGQHPWYYSPPNYPPIAALLFGGLDWLWQHKYITAQLHNLIRFPPAVFIIYFYKYGQILLYKLVPILCDLGLGIIAFKVTESLTKNYNSIQEHPDIIGDELNADMSSSFGGKPRFSKRGGCHWRAFGALTFFVLNPITIFISGAWGQTDSLVAIFGFLSFVLLATGKLNLSMFLFFVGMYIKPSWGIFIPFYLYALYLKKPNLKSILPGIIAVLITLFIVSAPFAEKGVIHFTKAMWVDKYIIPVKSVGKASVSAFNFHTIFLKVDRSLFNTKYLGVIPADKLGLIIFFVLNVIAFKFLKKQKNFLWGITVGMFILGLGSFLFMSNMLERYFFPGFAPLVIIMFTDFKTLVYGIIMNLVLMANVIWAFYRRGLDEIDHPFTGNNFLLIRVLSVVIVYSFAKITSKMLQFKRGR